jgi:hypothetical protein
MRTWTKRKTLIALLSIVVVCLSSLAFWVGGRREKLLEGTVETGFETSAFFPDGDCSRRPFWFNWPHERAYDMNARVLALGFPEALHVKLIGNVSRLGSYGHLGDFRREVWPIKVISVDPAPPCWPGNQRPDHFTSPDGNIVALIRYPKPLFTPTESRIQITTKDARVLAERNYGSEDGKHGYGITRAAWTPDSQFFVYKLESSGGQEPWHSPVHFFSRRDNKIVELDPVLKDAVSNTQQFLVSPPDRVTVDLWFSKQTRTVSLGHLLKP